MNNKSLLFKQKFLKDGFQSFCHDEEMKQCPLCGFEYIHIATISIYRNTLDTVVRINENELPQIGIPYKTHDELYEKCNKRGTTIMTSYWCENGDHWVHIENFHKGLVLNADVFIGNEAWDKDLANKELWRD